MSKEEVIKEVLSNIESDVQRADFRWSLFVAAANSYRYDSVLRPFPSQFVRTDDFEKDIESLRTNIECIPPFKSLLNENQLIENIPVSAVNLLHWVLSCGSFNLQLMPQKKFDVIQKLTGQAFSTPLPNYIFKVDNSYGAQQFQKISAGKKTYFAYHGSNVQNFHSILHNGLIAHLNKNGLFGKGTYLSSELSVSLPYSPMGNCWKHSIFGLQMSCVAVCEIIDHPDVKCQVKGENTSSRQCSQDSLAGNIPDKYYLVQNNDLVCLRYILVYNNRTRITNRTLLPHWWSKYRFTILMISYIVILVGIGLSTRTT